ncbi:unnamed protein product [Mytilus coruscus]|uniref:Uncharacterized protein n=1 Tax=Mytilus coruscus TaxID=42192 RepID=A0A6J8D4S6_MYTCO|nr:unnamed protein product [Mytilus coruscus]
MYRATTGTVISSEIHVFKQYRTNFGDSALTLYNGIMGTNTVFGDELLPASMTYTEYNRKQCAQFMEGLLKLLLRAVEMDLAYLHLDPRTAASVHNHTSDWETRLHSVRRKMLKTDSIIVSKYHEQSGDDKHYQRDCGGFLKFRSNGHNISVASKDKTFSQADLNEAKSIINHVHDNEAVHLHRPKDHVVHRFVDAHHTYDSFNAKAKNGCSPYAAAGVVDNKAKPSYKASPNRLYLKQAYYHYIHVFG